MASIARDTKLFDISCIEPIKAETYRKRLFPYEQYNKNVCVWQEQEWPGIVYRNDSGIGIAWNCEGWGIEGPAPLSFLKIRLLSSAILAPIL